MTFFRSAILIGVFNFTLLAGIVPAQAYSHSCYTFFLQKNKVTPTENPAAEKKSFLSPGYKVLPNGAFQIHLTPGRNIFERSINAVVDMAMQFILRRLGVTSVYPKLEKFLKDTSDRPYFTKLADNLGLKSTYSDASLKNIPASGPVIFVANHPLAGIEGIAIMSIIEQVRPDAKIALNSLLSGVPGMLENSIPLNPFGGAKAAAYNLSRKQDMNDLVASGGALVLFPAGAVSLKEKLSDPYAVDPQWRKGVAAILEKVPNAQVVPVFVEGQPSQQFLEYKIKRPNLAMAMIIKDLTTRLDENVELIFGAPIDATSITSLGNKQAQMDYLRARTYALKNLREQKVSETRILAEIAPAIEPDILTKELSKLPVLYDQNPEKSDKGFKIVLARANQIPQSLLEIGRLREITFRSVGEGSGKERDLDEFDSYYLHIIAIKKDSGKIAGSYRIGLIDQILKAKGFKGLYTSQFFGYEAMLPLFQNGIELGRSFVIPEYQRSFALLALFRGIAQFLVQNPHYQHLIGSVSISNDYSENSKLLMVEFLKKVHGQKTKTPVQNVTPLQFETLLNDAAVQLLLKDISTVNQLESLIQQIEGSKIRLPPLIQIYLSLGVKFLSFDFDRTFNTIDGFIWTDLAKQPVSELEKYMGEENAANYLRHHHSKP